MIALRNNKFHMVKKLVKHENFDPYIVNGNGETFSQIAR